MSQFEYLQLNRRLVWMENKLKQYEEDKYYSEWAWKATLEYTRNEVEKIKAKILYIEQQKNVYNSSEKRAE